MAAPFLHSLPSPSRQRLCQESTKCLPYLSGILSCSGYKKYKPLKDTFLVAVRIGLSRETEH
ncbi:hypothetical protein ACRRTK_023375 [Alexandromys fortis]